MLIDTHCHVDQFESPEGVVRECEKRTLRVVAVTNLPSHYPVAAERLRENRFVYAALGMHPLFAAKGIRELAAFKRMVPSANFIGEIGLDFSPKGHPSKAIQERVFGEVLRAIADRQRFITLHSRGAEAAVLEKLLQHGIQRAVFHWYSGSAKVLDAILAAGHFVSINPAMLSSASGRRVIECSPRERVLLESDGPFTKVHGSICTPVSVTLVCEALAARWGISFEEASLCMNANFERIVAPFLSTLPL